MNRLLAGALGLALTGLAFRFDGLRALAYLGLYLLTLLPGLPVGWRLFGRHTPLGWIAGALIGYALSCLAFWLPAWLGWAHPLSFALAWGALVAIVCRLAPLRAAAAVPLPTWSSRDTTRWLLLLAIVLVYLAVPFSRVGEPDTTGTRHYRSYFTADFVWHMAMTEELARFEFPPTNPYLAPDPIHYYWTYFVVPAAISGRETARLLPIESALKITAIGTGLLMFSTVFFAAWSVTGRSGAALAAGLLALSAPSWEGLYTLQDFWTRGLSPAAMFNEVRQMNIDAVTNWRFQGLRIDGLVRSMWWTPQHSLSFSLGLAAIVAAATRAVCGSRAGAGLVGLCLALSVATNPFLGAAFSLAYGLVVAWRIARGDARPVALVHQVWAVAPVALGLGWTMLNQMGGGAGDAVSIGWSGLGRNAPVTTMVLSLGGLIVPALLWLAFWRRRPAGDAWVAVPVVLVALMLAWFVSLTDRAWVGFRAGNLLQVSLPMLAASGLAALTATSRAAAISVTLLLVLAGAPTTLIDVFNAQDLENRAMGPGFHWVIPISPAQQAGFRWIRANTPADAVVQADPIVRGREDWSTVPSFAGRRMAAGDPISLLATPDYATRSRAVHDALIGADATASHAALQGLGVQYVWLDEDDDPNIGERLRTRPDLFGLGFRRGAVWIFVIRGTNGLP